MDNTAKALPSRAVSFDYTKALPAEARIQVLQQMRHNLLVQAYAKRVDINNLYDQGADATPEGQHLLSQLQDAETSLLDSAERCQTTINKITGVISAEPADL